MISELPLDAEEIFVEWVTTEGGIGVTAFTDKRGLPFIGLYPINGTGQPNGLPCRFRRGRLMVDVVIGFKNRTPLVIFIDVEVNKRGLSLIVCLPSDIGETGYQRTYFAPWGSNPPRYGFTVIPASIHRPVHSYPGKGDL